MSKGKSGKLGVDLSAAVDKLTGQPKSRKLGGQTRPHPAPDGWQIGGRDGRDS